MVEQKKGTYRSHEIEEFVIENEPFYIPVADEIELFETTVDYRFGVQT